MGFVSSCCASANGAYLGMETVQSVDKKHAADQAMVMLLMKCDTNFVSWMARSHLRGLLSLLIQSTIVEVQGEDVHLV